MEVSEPMDLRTFQKASNSHKVALAKSDTIAICFNTEQLKQPDLKTFVALQKSFSFHEASFFLLVQFAVLKLLASVIYLFIIFFKKRVEPLNNSLYSLLMLIVEIH